MNTSHGHPWRTVTVSGGGRGSHRRLTHIVLIYTDRLGDFWDSRGRGGHITLKADHLVEDRHGVGRGTRPPSKADIQGWPASKTWERAYFDWIRGERNRRWNFARRCRGVDTGSSSEEKLNLPEWYTIKSRRRLRWGSGVFIRYRRLAFNNCCGILLRQLLLHYNFIATSSLHRPLILKEFKRIFKE